MDQERHPILQKDEDVSGVIDREGDEGEQPSQANLLGRLSLHSTVSVFQFIRLPVFLFIISFIDLYQRQVLH